MFLFILKMAVQGFIDRTFHSSALQGPFLADKVLQGRSGMESSIEQEVLLIEAQRRKLCCTVNIRKTYL